MRPHDRHARHLSCFSGASTRPPHAAIVKVLAGKYQENRQALGLINEKAVMEVFTSPKGTWTMLVTDQRRLSCIIAAGEAWEQTPVLAQGTGI